MNFWFVIEDIGPDIENTAVTDYQVVLIDVFPVIVADELIVKCIEVNNKNRYENKQNRPQVDLTGYQTVFGWFRHIITGGLMFR